jgi:hypothetical protein
MIGDNVLAAANARWEKHLRDQRLQREKEGASLQHPQDGSDGTIAPKPKSPCGGKKPLIA